MTTILQKQRAGQVYTANSMNKTSMMGGMMSEQQSVHGNMQSMGMQQSTSIGNRRSLNRDQRKRDLMKITRENQMILKRLQDKSANYNVSRWQREDDKRIKILKNICEYPLIHKDVYNQPDFIIKKKKSASAHNVGSYYKKRGYGTNNQNQSSVFQNQIIKKETLFTGLANLGNGDYVIEILISQTDDLVISAQH